MQREERNLTVVLTAEEAAQRSYQMAHAIEEIDSIEYEAKLKATKAKNKIKDLRKDVVKLGRAVLTGTEPRMIECTWNRDEDRQVMELYRTDTGTMVDSRAMTEPERQRKLFPVTSIDPAASGTFGGTVEG